MSVLIEGIDMPKKRHLDGYYFDSDGKVWDISRRQIVGSATQYNEIEKNNSKWESGRYRSVDQTGETYDDGEAWICPSCRNAFKKTYVDPRWNYCPHCGADMRGEGNEN